MTEFTYDVVVVGGGPAGFAAAVGSARQGAKTALIERYGFCGGMATVGGVSVYMNEHAGKTNVAGKIFNEFTSCLLKDGAAYTNDDIANSVVANPEDIKLVCDQMLVESGVDVFYHLLLEDVDVAENIIQSITVTDKCSHKYRFKGSIYVDCTGDADLAYRAGLETEVGRPRDGLCQPMTMVYSLGPVNIQKSINAGSEVIQNKYLWWADGNPSLLKFIQQAKEKDEWPVKKECFSLIWSDPRNPEIVTVNGSRITGLNGADAIDLSRAEIEGRKQVKQLVDFMRNYLPGFEEAVLLKTGPQIGVRETRRVIGPYKLTEEDVLSCRKFEDQIAQVAYYIDVHLPNSEKTDLRRLPEGESYDIPYRCLQSNSCNNFLVAGRAISASHIAASSARVMPVCMSTGEAAGTAAAMSYKNINVKDIDILKIQEIIGISNNRR